MVRVYLVFVRATPNLQHLNRHPPDLCRASTSTAHARAKTWMAGPSPAMTNWETGCHVFTSRIDAHLFELIGDLVEAGLGAGLVLVAAGRARYADRADHVFPDLDRQPAGA